MRMEMLIEKRLGLRDAAAAAWGLRAAGDEWPPPAARSGSGTIWGDARLHGARLGVCPLIACVVSADGCVVSADGGSLVSFGMEVR